MFLGWLFPKIAKINEIHEELVAMATDWQNFENQLKINHWSDFEIIFQK
jgi:hypothetical protein